jgi:hypothetical protein
VPTGATARPNDEWSPRQSAPLGGSCATDHHGPFAWQDGRRLWLLDGGPVDWVLAELLFDPETCRYLEVRRSQYRWPREAAGALLSRSLNGAEHRAEDAARSLSEWIARTVAGRRY